MWCACFGPVLRVGRTDVAPVLHVCWWESTGKAATAGQCYARASVSERFLPNLQHASSIPMLLGQLSVAGVSDESGLVVGRAWREQRGAVCRSTDCRVAGSSRDEVACVCKSCRRYSRTFIRMHVRTSINPKAPPRFLQNRDHEVATCAGSPWTACITLASHHHPIWWEQDWPFFWSLLSSTALIQHWDWGARSF